MALVSGCGTRKFIRANATSSKRKVRVLRLAKLDNAGLCSHLSLSLMNNYSGRIKLMWLGYLLVGLLAGRVQAVTFNITYDASVTASTNSANIQSAFGAATQILQNLYTNSSTVNITVYWGNVGPFVGGIGLGASQTQFTGSSGFKYPQLTNALRTARTTAADSNSVASLPANDPTGGGQSLFVPRAEAKALGVLIAANDPALDGEIGFATNKSYTFDATNRAVAGKFDFISVALHEITEVMGRNTLNLDGVNYVPYDLFRFTNSGARSFNPNATNAYFSVDNGATALRYFFTNINQGDIMDWLSSGATDSCDASISSGKKGVLSYADLTSLDVIGYKLNYSLPRLTLAKAGTNYVLNFTNTPGTTYTVLATTNLTLTFSNWPTLGTSTDSVPGQFFFTDTQAKTNTLRFYRVRLN